MSEQRLINANELKIMLEQEYRHSKMFKENAVYRGWQGAIQILYDQPTIDPETLPIVRELTEKLAQALAEKDAVLKEIAGECGLCAHYDACKKNHYSCTNGSDWEYRGLHKEG